MVVKLHTRVHLGLILLRVKLYVSVVVMDNGVERHQSVNSSVITLVTKTINKY